MWLFSNTQLIVIIFFLKHFVFNFQDQEGYSRVRTNSAVHIRVYKKPLPLCWFRRSLLSYLNPYSWCSRSHLFSLTGQVSTNLLKDNTYWANILLRKKPGRLKFLYIVQHLWTSVQKSCVMVPDPCFLKDALKPTAYIY